MSEPFTKNPTVLISFMWATVQPDPRQWKPSMPVLQPNSVNVVVEVPLKNEYVYNAEQLIAQSLGSGNVAKLLPILTPHGMRYCVDVLESAMTQHVSSSDDTVSNDSWDDVDDDTEEVVEPKKPTKQTNTKSKTKFTSKKTKVTTSDDSWDEDTDTDETEDKETEFNFDD